MPWPKTGTGGFGWERMSDCSAMGAISNVWEIGSTALKSPVCSWIGTASYGSARAVRVSIRCKDGSFTSLRRADGLASDFVMALAEDQEGSLWVGTWDE